MTVKSRELYHKMLHDSLDAVLFVAKQLMLKGHTVQLDGIKPMEEGYSQGSYSDGGDVLLVDNGEIWEVKGLSINFTTEDFPYDPKFIVNSVPSHHKAMESHACAGYVVVSADRKAYGVVPIATAKDWYVEKRSSPKYVEVLEYYFCPMDQVIFREAV